ncbi:Uncharacterised protein [Mycobacteroides abscessus subsp. abscessus]|nr:Uncharacterised protein [Mycobacteroides abscessus subsp. abscessus]
MTWFWRSRVKTVPSALPNTIRPSGRRVIAENSVFSWPEMVTLSARPEAMSRAK